MDDLTIKISFISNMFPSPSDPSYGVFVERSYEDLQQHGFDISNMVVIRGRSKGFGKLLLYIKHLAKLTFILLKSENRNIYAHYASHHCIPLALGARFLGKQVIVHVHGDEIAMDDGIHRKVAKLGQSTLLHASKLIVVPSLFFQEMLVTIYPSLNQTKIVISPSSGVMIEEFESSINEHTCYWESTQIHGKTAKFGYVGRIDSDKGWEVLFEAFCMLPGELRQYSRLHFWGDGKEASKLQARVTENGLEDMIFVHGQIPGVDIPAIHAKFDFQVVPSTRESLGLAAIEGLAAGHVVLCTRIRPFVDFTQDGKHAVHFSVGDINSLRDAMIKVLTWPAETNRAIATEGRKLANSFSRRVVASELANTIRKALNVQ